MNIEITEAIVIDNEKESLEGISIEIEDKKGNTRTMQIHPVEYATTMQYLIETCINALKNGETVNTALITDIDLQDSNK